MAKGFATLDEDALEKFILRSVQQQRYLQETPLLPDVWVQLAKCAVDRMHDLDRYADLLIIPHHDSNAATVAAIIGKNLDGAALSRAMVAALRSEVAARLTFSEVFRIVMPMSTIWKNELENQSEDRLTMGDAMLQRAASVIENRSDERVHSLIDTNDRAPIWRLLLLAGLTAYLEASNEASDSAMVVKKCNALLGKLLDGTATAGDVRHLLPPLRRLWEERLRDTGEAKIWLVNENRPASLAINKSRNTVKADAVSRLFDIDTSTIRWAVVDAGIDARHPAFAERGANGQIDKNAWIDPKLPSLGIKPDKSRIVATYDFTRVRTFLSMAGGAGAKTRAFKKIAHHAGLSQDAAEVVLRNVYSSVMSRGVVEWSQILPLLTVSHDEKHYECPTNNHGSHVAGILSAEWKQQRDSKIDPDEANTYKRDVVGIAPRMRLYDLRILNADGTADEFSTIAALQFISYLNRDRSVMAVHGVNISLQIPHKFRNFACGQTPICLECDRLMAEGVVVVAAAGNHGYEVLKTNGAYAHEALLPISISDPGNAQSVITVGSTHRESPHTYGVSYFSGRGPTGDGRRKPDLLAPGERIFSTMLVAGDPPRPLAGPLDGTSMSAPHVSGAAALLLARHPELVGRPQRVKDILMRSATDLGREPLFQGAGLVDILRALQLV